MLDEHTRVILTRIRNEYGEAFWLEGVLDTLEVWRVDLELRRLNRRLQGEMLQKETQHQEEDKLQEDYDALRAYALALLEAGVEYSSGLSLVRDLMGYRGSHA